ncbi:MAG: beta-propeller fold lactonase family protein [Spirochaetales bacterium]|nr:beta-propeller fold lactonase family protein [Spirochaetales bacterium]
MPSIKIIACLVFISGLSGGFSLRAENADKTNKSAQYKITIDLVYGSSDIAIDGKPAGRTPVKIELEEGRHTVKLTRKKYPDMDTYIDVKEEREWLFRHNPVHTFGKQLGVFKCGRMPKQVIFTPDDKYLYVILWDGKGYQIFDMENLEIRNLVDVKQHTGKASFVEGLFIPETNRFLVSQVTTAMISEYDITDPLNPAYLRKMSTKGTWPKFFAYSSVIDKIAASNWLSHDVSIMTYSTGKLVCKLNGMRMPRGVVFTNDGKYLFIASFDSGLILKYDTATWKEVKRIYKKHAAMRHIVLTKDNKSCFVSNMNHSEIYMIDPVEFRIIKTYKVFNNPNTIELSPDDRYLFVSCRGPNNPESYLKRSPKDGQVFIIDVKNQEIIARIDGGNQPTGLDVSGNGIYLAFSNFRGDNNIDIYDISELKNKN